MIRNNCIQKLLDIEEDKRS